MCGNIRLCPHADVALRARVAGTSTPSHVLNRICSSLAFAGESTVVGFFSLKKQQLLSGKRRGFGSGFVCLPSVRV